MSLYRNIRARDQLEVFLLSAVSSLLLVRLYLHLTGYPQIATGGLHIAHMLWGGVLMLVALVIMLSFLGARAQAIAAVVGGAGFGVFIDELGKFITRDHNYFYEPAIGIIYAIFIILYLIFNFLSRRQPLSSREYQLNALAQLEEAVAHNMDPAEKARVQELLAAADQRSPITRKLQELLADLPVAPRARPKVTARFRTRLDRAYEWFWHRRNSGWLVRAFFVAEALFFVGGVAVTVYNNVDEVLDLFTGTLSYSMELAIGQLLASLVAAGFAVRGAVGLRRGRMYAYEQFRRATLVNIFLTQFFMFVRTEFAALPGFFFNILLLALIGYAMYQERRLSRAAH